MSHDEHWCAIDPCEDCQAEEEERERYYDELAQRQEEKQREEITKRANQRTKDLLELLRQAGVKF